MKTPGRHRHHVGGDQLGRVHVGTRGISVAQLAIIVIARSPKRAVRLDKHRVQQPRRHRHHVAGDDLGRHYVGARGISVAQLAIGVHPHPPQRAVIINQHPVARPARRRHHADRHIGRRSYIINSIAEPELALAIRTPIQQAGISHRHQRRVADQQVIQARTRDRHII